MNECSSGWDPSSTGSGTASSFTVGSKWTCSTDDFVLLLLVLTILETTAPPVLHYVSHFNCCIYGRHLRNSRKKYKMVNHNLQISFKLYYNELYRQPCTDEHYKFYFHSIFSLIRTFLLLLFVLQSLDEGVSDRSFRVHLQRWIQQRKVFFGMIPEFTSHWSMGVGVSGVALQFRLQQSFTVCRSFGDRLSSRLPCALREWYGNQFHLRVLNGINDE